MFVCVLSFFFPVTLGRGRGREWEKSSILRNGCHWNNNWVILKKWLLGWILTSPILLNERTLIKVSINCSAHISLVKAVVFLSDDKGKLQALTYNTPVSNLWLLLSHPRSSHLWVTICACVCFMYNSAGEVAVYWGEMFWAHSSCCHIRLDFLLGIGWEDTHPGYVGGNLCCVAEELLDLQKSDEKSSRGCWRRRGSHHLLHCWYPLVLMVCCKPPAGLLPLWGQVPGYRVI